MLSEEITLRRDYKGEWRLYAPKGHTVGPSFRGSEYKALEWATAWVSSFNNWSIKIEGEGYAKASGMSSETV